MASVAPMTRRTASMRLLAEVAALARIDELATPREADGKGAAAPSDQAVHRRERRRRMTDHTRTATASVVVQAKEDADRQLKTATRAAWALGDYHRFALETVWGLGPVLVEACGISTGQRVLDVAAGTGNTAIRAAEAGAEVVASDLTPENFPAGRRQANANGVELDWVEADAEQLPFDDRQFDVVTLLVRGDVRPQPPGRGRRARAGLPDPEARSGCSTSRPRAWRPTSSGSSRPTRHHPRRERCRRSGGGARSTCGGCSTGGWRRWR